MTACANIIKYFGERVKLSDNKRFSLITHINDFEELLLGSEFIKDEE